MQCFAMKKETMPFAKDSSILSAQTSSSAVQMKSPSASACELLLEPKTSSQLASCSSLYEEGGRRTFSLPSLRETNESPPLFPGIPPDLREDPSFFASTRLLQVLGAGRVSKVFKAENPQTKALFVAKITDTATEEGLQASKQEMIFLSKKITHENIIKYLEGRSLKNHQIIYQEYFSERDLCRFLSLVKRPPLSLSKKIIFQLIDALVFLHERRIAHLDVKPENILVNDCFQIKLIDFGSSRLSLSNGSIESYGGTALYASPEAVSGGIYNGFLADAWSLGVLFFLMANGYHPRPKAPPVYSSDISPNIQEVINGLLEHHPEKRTPISMQLKKEINTADIRQEKDER